MATEMTQVVHSNAALDAEFLRSMFQGAEIALLACAADGTIVAANAAAEQLFPSNLTPGLSVVPVFEESQRPDVTAALQHCLSTLKPVELQLQLDPADKRRWFSICLTPVVEADATPRGVAFSFREITATVEERRAADKQRTLSSLGELAGAVAHHYNNLLTCIATTIDYANNMNTLAAMKRALGRASEPLQRAAQISQQLLAFAQADYRHRDMADLTECVLQFFDEHEEAWLLRHVRLELDCQPIPICSVPRAAIQLVLRNLTDNALDAMNGGGSIRAELRMKDKDHVLLTITDSGAGIDPQMMEHLFEPFQTTKGELSHCGPGQGRNPGLGLAVAHGLIGAMRGEIKAANAPTGGARFEIVLPIGQH